MARNPYFNFFPGDQVTSEQLLIEDLVIESMKIHGHDMYYIPRESRDEIDALMGEEQLKSYTNAYVLEFYIQNVTGMEGEQDLFSKFGLEIRDEINLLVSRRRFRFTVPNAKRPYEGDLVYIPLMQNFYEITHVEHENDAAMFYTLGRGRDAQVYVYALKLRQFVFSEEQIQTGVDEVDGQIQDAYRPLRLVFNTGGVRDYDFINQEVVYQGANVAFATAKANAYAWTLNTRTLDIIKVSGTFVPGLIVKGLSSNAQWTLSTVNQNDALDTMFEDLVDNKEIRTEANTILDWSETNPFGNPLG